MAAQHFFVEGRYLGSRTIHSYRQVPGLEVRWHHSYALYCIRCGEIWARFLHEGAPLTQLTQRLCTKHGDGRLSNLHFFQGDPHDDAIRYEFTTMLAQADKE